MDELSAVAITEKGFVSQGVPSAPTAGGDRLTGANSRRNQGSMRQSTNQIETHLRRNKSQARVTESSASRTGDPGPIASIGVEDVNPDPELSESEPEDQEGDEPRLRSLSGWVFDEAGGGVPELVVVAEARRLAPEAVEAAAGAARSATARTDGEGFFALPGLIEGEYAVRTESSDRYESATGMYRAGVDLRFLLSLRKDGSTGDGSWLRGER